MFLPGLVLFMCADVLCYFILGSSVSVSQYIGVMIALLMAYIGGMLQ